MENLKGACIIGQSGAPTAVINASAQGVIQPALASPQITRVLGAAHGIKGVLADQLYDMGQEDPGQLELLQFTPSSALGSCRYKLADPDVDDTDYKRILEHHRGPQNHRQRPVRHRPLPRLRQRRQVHRHLLHGALPGRPGL